MLPLEVLQRAGAEITNYGGSGMSVMEMSHRSKIFLKIFDETQEKFRKLLGVPEGYKVLFLQGGGTMQFGMIPLNLIGRTGQADYAVTGHFANLAMKEAKKYGQVTIAASSEDRKHVYIPAQEQLKLNPDASYFYYCSNNTIEGTQWQYVPETGSVPLACDMSSDILSRPVDVSKFGLIFAGADVAAVVEKGKAAYVGPEIQGKTLGVVGLGAIGVLVANAAAALGMQIVGYDPFLSVQHALNLTPGVKVVSTLEELYGQADYISLHLPMTPETKGTLNDAAFAAMKDGVRIVNLARGELVDTEALKAALASGKCAAYVTDFPNSETAAMEGVVAIPHLGASTPESEDNCAMMAARQVRDYLDNGNIVNSVNLPVLSMAWAAKNRVCVLTKGADAAAIAAAVPAVASASKTRGEYGYFLLDTDAQVDTAAIAALPGVLRVRVLHQ